jgi:hypothetical protein
MKKAGYDGIAAGDIETAMCAFVVYTQVSIIAARTLVDLHKEGLGYIDRMKLHRQDLLLNWQLPLMHAISTLIGETKTRHPVSLTDKRASQRQ